MSAYKPPVFVIPRDALFPLFTPQGFFRFDEPEFALRHVASIPTGGFRERAQAEESPDCKQIIPQVCLHSCGKIFVHRIPATGGEPRLHDLWTIFLGGHIEETCDSIGGARPHVSRLLNAVERVFAQLAIVTGATISPAIIDGAGRHIETLQISATETFAQLADEFSKELVPPKQPRVPHYLRKNPQPFYAGVPRRKGKK